MIQLLSIDDPKVLFNRAPNSPSFSWWYIDALNEQGDGCVCIFSQGLPFLPASSTPKSERYAVNVVIYKEGKEAFYLLQEFPKSEVHFETSESHPLSIVRKEVWRIGGHTFHRHIQNGTVDCTVELCSSTHNSIAQAVGAHSVTGNIQVSGPLLSGMNTAGQVDSSHQWIPLTTQCTAKVLLEIERESMSFSGRAYHDSNISTQALDELSIGYWWWARASFEEYTWVVYLVEPTESFVSDERSVWMVASVSPRGKWKQHEVQSVTVHTKKQSLYGLSMPARWEIYLESGVSLQIEKVAWLDDSPFYQRVQVRMTYEGKTGLGFMEHVVPTKLNIPWQQPFIRMKTHFQNTPGSFFSPLFTGPSNTRWSRQLAQCLPF